MLVELGTDVRPGQLLALRIPDAGRRTRDARARRDLVIGAALLVACWRRASLGLAVAAALVLSPIVWLDYYAVAAIPLAIVRPRLSWVWLAPIATWGLLSAGVGAGNGWGSARVLIVFGIVFAVIVRGERQAESGGRGPPRHGRACTGGPHRPEAQLGLAERPEVAGREVDLSLPYSGKKTPQLQNASLRSATAVIASA